MTDRQATPDDPAEAKRDLRKRMYASLSGLPASAFVREGREAAAALMNSDKWEKARSVLCFLSMDGEISTDVVLNAALSAGKAVAVPVVAGGDILFRYVDGVDLAWTFGPYGIREPPAGCPQAWPGLLEGPVLVVVPGMAFDASGGRIGHGKGFYDRFLKSLRSLRPDSFTVGFCMDCQMIESVPMADHDERLDAVASRAGMVKVEGRAERSR